MNRETYISARIHDLQSRVYLSCKMKGKKKKNLVTEFDSGINKWMFFMRVCFCVGASEPVRTSVCPDRGRGAVVDTARASESF